MALLLLASAAVSGFALGKDVDAAAILAIVVANTVIALVCICALTPDFVH